MKKVLGIWMVIAIVFGIAIVAVSEEVRYPIYEFDLTLQNTTRGQGTGQTGVSPFVIDGGGYDLDLKMVNPGLGVFTMSPYMISGHTNTFSSGNTYTLTYSVTNVPNPMSHHYTNSGTTIIYGPIAMSGTTGKNYTFTPEFGRWYRFFLETGISRYEHFRVRLIIQ